MKDTRITCAVVYDLRNQLEYFQKESKTGLKTILSATARGVCPDPKEIESAEELLTAQKLTIEKLLVETEGLKQIAATQSMNQMVMNFKEE